jgi:hypothetical protein
MCPNSISIGFRGMDLSWLFNAGICNIDQKSFVIALIDLYHFWVVAYFDKLGYGLLAYYIGTGLFFGIMSLMDEGIELAIGFHVANNLITALLVTADWTAFQTESLFKDVSNPSLLPELILFLVFIYPLTLVLLAKKYRWGNWAYKLTARIYDDKT